MTRTQFRPLAMLATAALVAAGLAAALRIGPDPLSAEERGYAGGWAVPLRPAGWVAEYEFRPDRTVAVTYREVATGRTSPGNGWDEWRAAGGRMTVRRWVGPIRYARNSYTGVAELGRWEEMTWAVRPDGPGAFVLQEAEIGGVSIAPPRAPARLARLPAP